MSAGYAHAQQQTWTRLAGHQECCGTPSARRWRSLGGEWGLLGAIVGASAGTRSRKLGDGHRVPAGITARLRARAPLDSGPHHHSRRPEQDAAARSHAHQPIDRSRRRRCRGGKTRWAHVGLQPASFGRARSAPATRSSGSADAGRFSRPDEAGLVGEHDGLDPVTDPDLGQRVCHVALDRRLSEVESRRDLCVGEAARQEF